MLAVLAAADDELVRGRSSIARPSTPSRAARSATPARSPPTPAGRGHRHDVRAARPSPPRGASRRGHDHGRPGGRGERSTSSVATAIRRNHTGTHLLHQALRRVLGDHVKQAGSLVGPDRLRFDFCHYEPVTDEQIAEIERLANAETLRNAPARAFETTKAEAEAMGAIAFFGDKYGDMVRVLEAGPSVELCGGTHVSATGDIGLLKVVSEASIGSNLRRIEAITGAASVELLQRDEQALAQVARLVGTTAATSSPACSASSTRSRRSRSRSSRCGRSRPRAGRRAGGVGVRRRGRRSVVDGVEPGDLRDLAIAVRQQPGVRRVVLDRRHTDRRRQSSSPPCSRRRRSKRPTSSRPPRERSAAVAAARVTSPPPGARIRRVSTRRCGSPPRLPTRDRPPARPCGRSGSIPERSGSAWRSAIDPERWPRH